MSMDGIKNGVGLESQLAKYAFLEYDVLAKMPIYESLGLISIGIEIVQVSRLRRLMSSGVGDFERLVTNLVTRGERSDDFPVLVLGIDVDPAVPRCPIVSHMRVKLVQTFRAVSRGLALSDHSDFQGT